MVLNKDTKVPSIYLGETGRSLYERGKDHWRDYRDGKSDSHMLKHQKLHHKDSNKPIFHLRPLRFHRTGLNRQISEAVQIGRRKSSQLQREFNRCKITRLTLGGEESVDVQKMGEEEANCGEEETSCV